jgi:hypothetical protein
MGHHDDGEAEALLEITDEGVEIGCRDRVETGGGLVQEEEQRIEAQGAGETRTLAHAAGQLGRIFRRCVERQADQRYLHRRDLVEQRMGQLQLLLQRHLDVLGNGERAEERAILEQHAPARGDMLPLPVVETADLFAEDLDRAGFGGEQADDGAQENRLAGTRRTNDAHDFARHNVQVDILMQHPPADARHEIADLDDRRPRLGGIRYGGGQRGWRRLHR